MENIKTFLQKQNENSALTIKALREIAKSKISDKKENVSSSFASIPDKIKESIKPGNLLKGVTRMVGDLPILDILGDNINKFSEELQQKKQDLGAAEKTTENNSTENNSTETFMKESEKFFENISDCETEKSSENTESFRDEAYQEKTLDNSTRQTEALEKLSGALGVKSKKDDGDDGFWSTVMGIAGGALSATLIAPLTTGLTTWIAGLGATAMAGILTGLGGLVWALVDGIRGMFEFGGISGFVGGLLGGMSSGIKGMFMGAGKFAMIGVGVGALGGPIGMILGGALGALMGGILGLFGGKRISAGLKSISTFFTSGISKLWGGFKSLISMGISSVWESFKNLITFNIFGVVTKMLSGTKVGNMLDGIGSYISEGIATIWDKFKEMISYAIAKVKFYINPLNWGKDFEESDKAKELKQDQIKRDAIAEKVITKEKELVKESIITKDSSSVNKDSYINKNSSTEKTVDFATETLPDQMRAEIGTISDEKKSIIRDSYESKDLKKSITNVYSSIIDKPSNKSIIEQKSDKKDSTIIYKNKKREDLISKSIEIADINKEKENLTFIKESVKAEKAEKAEKIQQTIKNSQITESPAVSIKKKPAVSIKKKLIDPLKENVTDEIGTKVNKEVKWVDNLTKDVVNNPFGAASDIQGKLDGSQRDAVNFVAKLKTPKGIAEEALQLLNIPKIINNTYVTNNSNTKDIEKNLTSESNISGGISAIFKNKINQNSLMQSVGKLFTSKSDSAPQPSNTTVITDNSSKLAFDSSSDMSVSNDDNSLYGRF